MVPPLSVRRTTVAPSKQQTADLQRGANKSEDTRLEKRHLGFAQQDGLQKKVEKLQQDELEKLQKELNDLRMQVSGQAPPSSASHHEFLSTSSQNKWVRPPSAMHRRRNDDARNAWHTPVPASTHTHMPIEQAQLRNNGTVFLAPHGGLRELPLPSGHHDEPLSSGLMIAVAGAAVHVVFCLAACCYWCLVVCKDLHRRGFTVFFGQGKDGKTRLRFIGKKER